MSARLSEWLRRANLFAGVVLLGLAAPLCAQTASFSGLQIASGLNSPFGIAVSGAGPEAGDVYVANETSDTVSVINPANNTVVATVPVGSDPAAIAVIGAGPEAGDVFVANETSDSVSVIDPTTNKVVATVLVGSNPSAIAVNGTGTLVFVANFGSDTVSIINPTTDAVVATVFVGEGPAGIAVGGAGTVAGDVFVANFGSNTVSVINPVTSTVAFTVLVGDEPAGIAVSGAGPEAGDVFVANEGSDTVSVINPANNTVVATVPVGSDPFAIALDGSGNVFVANVESNTVSVIDPATNTVVATVPVGAEPAGIAVDGSENVFVADLASGNLLKETLSGVNFGSVAVATTPPPTQKLRFTFTSEGTIGAPAVLTQGAAKKDFTDAGRGTCTTNGPAHAYAAGDTCTVAVAFTPTYPGPRYGAVELLNSTGTAVIASANVFGIGTGPQVVFQPSTSSVLAVGSPGSEPLAQPEGVAVDGAGDVYIADSDNNRIVEVTATGVASVLNVGTPGGEALSSPNDVAVDGAGDVYISDTGNSRIVEVAAAGGASVLAVSPPGGEALSKPFGVAVDGAGDVYISDTGNNRIVEVTAAGVASVLNVGTPGGVGLSNSEGGVAVDAAGDVYIADLGNNRIVEVTAAGAASVLIVGTPGGKALSLPNDVVLDGAGDVYIADLGNSRIVELNQATPPTLIFATATDDGTTDARDGSDGVLSVTITNDGNELLTAVSPGLSVAANFTQVESGGPLTDCSASFSLAADASCNLSIEFAPAAPANGTVNGSVMLTDNSLNATSSTMQQIQLMGTAIEAAPTVTGVSPTSGPTTGGTGVMISGQNLTGVTAVNFGSTPAASFTFVNDNQIIAVSPAGTGTVNVTVTNSSGTSAPAPFTYVVPVSLVNSTVTASPATLPAGASTTITVTVKDVNSNLLSGVPVNVSVAGASGKATISSLSSTTSGIFSFALTDPVAEPVTITASLGSSGTLTSSVMFVVPAYVVTVNADESTGNGVATNCVDPNVSASGNTNCGLRDAVAAANALAGVTTSIGFANSLGSTLMPGTITIAQATPITLTQNMTITGPGASALTISGANQFQVMQVNSGVTAAIGNLTIAKGHSIMQGGGIVNAGTLTVTDSTFENNSAGGVPSGGNGGGAIFAAFGVLTVRNSTFAGNTSAPGGAINASDGTVTIDRSTFTENSALAPTTGGAVFINGNANVTITESTISNNLSDGGGGAVFNNATLTAANTIMAGNTGGDCGSNGDSICPANGTNGNVIGVANIGLAPLGNYGGPTQTMIPLPGSPAICAGSQTKILSGVTTDQRGLPNTNTSYPGFSAGAACVDAGAVQSNYALSFTQQPSNADAGVSMLPAPAVALTESGNAFTAAGVTIPLALSGPGTLSGGSATTSAGQATYSSLKVSVNGSGDTLTATLLLNPALTQALSLTTVSSEFNIIAGMPTAANSSFALPSTAVAGTTVTGTLTLKDKDGNLVLPTSVTFTTTSTTTTFSTPTTVMTASGAATISFSDTKAEAVTISVSVGGTSFLSRTVQITPAAPASVSVVSGSPQSATVNTQFAAPLVVVIEDKYGNPTPNVVVPSFGVPATGASATLTTVAETNTNGQANVTATANGTSGSYNATVTEQNTTATFALSNNAAPQTITFTQPASPVTYGVAPITLVASASSQLPVTFTVTGPATANGSILRITGAGTVGITANQAGNPTYGAATAVLRSLTVNQQPTVTSVGASSTVASPAQTVTLMATVATTIAGTPTMPSGTVTFFDNGTQLGAPVNVANGAATLTAPSLPSGATSSITATYSGDGNFVGSTSSNSVTIVAASLDFTFTNTGTSAYTAAPGAVATYSFALAPLYGSYAGPMSFTVTGLPAGATASFTPSTVPVGAGATPVVMTVQTASATAHNRNPFGRGIVLALLFLPFAGKRSVREKLKGRMFLLMLLIAGATATVTGCGSTSGFLLQNPQTYTLTITATSGTLEHSETVTLIVQ
jgi:YVTN family beta-propeller protein